jgi:uncharacterized protein (TIGR02217 family)
MPDFVEVLFPVDISKGATGGPVYSTSITVSASGKEYRQQMWKMSKRTWDVSHALRNQAMAQQLLSFFHNMAGRAIGFRFRDPLDNYVDPTAPEPLRQIDALNYQLQKRYSFGGLVVPRDITKPVSGTVRLWHDVTPIAPASYTLDTTTGLVTFGVDPGFIPASSFTFDIPVRFDTDQFSMTYEDLDVMSWERIPIVEIT